MAQTKPKLGPQEPVYRNRFQTIFRREADFGSHRKEYFIVDTGERVAMLVDGADGILLTRQYRNLIDGLSWEVPGGRADPGESLVSAAIRECAEETGVVCRAPTPLIHFLPGLDTYRNPTHIFYAREFDVRPEAFASPEEVSEHHWVPLPRCIEMIAKGDIVDSLSMIALLSYRAFVLERSGSRS